MNMLKAKLYQLEIEKQEAELALRGEQRKLVGVLKFVLTCSIHIRW